MFRSSHFMRIWGICEKKRISTPSFSKIPEEKKGPKEEFNSRSKCRCGWFDECSSGVKVEQFVYVMWKAKKNASYINMIDMYWYMNLNVYIIIIIP